MLEDLRISNDETQQMIADLLNCKREVYRRYEKDIYEIPVWGVLRLAKHCCASVDYILLAQSQFELVLVNAKRIRLFRPGFNDKIKGESLIDVFNRLAKLQAISEALKRSQAVRLSDNNND